MVEQRGLPIPQGSPLNYYSMKVELEEVAKEIESLAFKPHKTDREQEYNYMLISVLTHLEEKYNIEIDDSLGEFT